MIEPIVSIKPFLAVLVSIAAIPLIIVSRSPNWREGWTFAAATAKFLLVASLAATVLTGSTVEYTVADILPGVALRFRVDAMGVLFALVSSFLWIVTSAYSIGYMRGLSEHSQTRYFCFFALALSATIGVAFAADLFTLYLCYEILSFATYPLVTHHQDSAARSAGRKYLFYIVGASIGLVLPAMLVIYSLSGTLAFSASGLVPKETAPSVVAILLLCLVLGFTKAGIMPMHAWLPAAMVAPTPVSALLHAVAVVKVGAFSIVRVITAVFGPGLLSATNLNGMVCLLASVTIIAASLIALSQDGLKRRLAFSTISQLSYIVLGAAMLTPKGLVGGLLHIAMHAFGKITLFFCAGAIFVATGIKNISQMDGIGKRMPVTMGAFFIGSLGVIGLPPTGGFISKWYLILGAMEGEKGVLLSVILISSLLNAAYFLPIVYRAFFCAPEESMGDDKMREAPRWCMIPLVLTAAISVALFFFPKPFLALAKMAVRQILGG
ncbi:MAG: monovalent cation/H+ antiporter subunit D family protein [Desulfobacterales bacterium]|jgi:multicomponent Na+:H+ antiporter subunit D|nr:monovalent cation/H+ antiporter subunit D family protein [Desulfobacterales bacterium]